MSKRYKGAILSSTPPTTSTSSASGVWTEQQFMQGVASGSWPALAGAPTIGTATAGALSASVTFTAPTYTGSGITGYTVTSSPGGITGTGASSPVTVSGLTAGTPYTFTVTATTAAGQSSASAASNSVTPTAPNYIEEVFSTYLYTGNGSTQTITNGIDLATKGGMVWIKDRSQAYNNCVMDSVRGTTNANILYTNNSSGNQTDANAGISSYNSNGFTLRSDSNIYGTNQPTNDKFASWTFAKQPKFFDVVTYTGDGSVPRNIAHNLGSTPGCIIVKSTSSATNWAVYHRSLGATQLIRLNRDWASESSFQSWADTSPTSTQFTVGADGSVNASGQTYVAYLFAHNAGGFGLNGTDNVISCGTFTTDGSGNATVNLGYEPQWILTKQSNATNSWGIYDTMRAWSFSEQKYLLPDMSSSEGTINATNFVPTATGFTTSSPFATSAPYIYIAIRKGPMKVPTSGTSVFLPTSRTGNASLTTITSGFAPDVVLSRRVDNLDNGNESVFADKLRGTGTLSTVNYAAEYAGGATSGINEYTNTGIVLGINNNPIYAFNYATLPYATYQFQRAPSFFDEVCYTGTGSALSLTHNLGVAPEFILIKCRSGSSYWILGSNFGATTYAYKNDWGANASSVSQSYSGNVGFSAQPTATTVSLDTNTAVNVSGSTYAMWMWATCAGVSKVGTYTGTGALQTINCGFTTGARFVLITRIGVVGDVSTYIYDSARGITSSNDPYVLLESTSPQVTNTNYVDTTSTGFQVTAAASSTINVSGGTYIFLAIA